LKFLVVHIVL